MLLFVDIDFLLKKEERSDCDYIYFVCF